MNLQEEIIGENRISFAHVQINPHPKSLVEYPMPHLNSHVCCFNAFASVGPPHFLPKVGKRIKKYGKPTVNPIPPLPSYPKYYHTWAVHTIPAGFISLGSPHKIITIPCQPGNKWEPLRKFRCGRESEDLAAEETMGPGWPPQFALLVYSLKSRHIYHQHP